MKRKRENAEPPGSTADYEVGYKKPPVSHRFQKGQSGNPSGRPKKSKELTGEQEKLAKILLEEAYRPVEVREGGKTIRIPTIQAVIRAQMLAGAGGNQKAAKEAITSVHDLENRMAQRHFENFAALLQYKFDMEGLIARRRQLGLDVSGILPHPDDIILNPRTGEARIKGPIDEREKAVFEEIRRKGAEMKQFLVELENLLSGTRNKTQKEAISNAIKRTKILLRRYQDFMAANDSETHGLT